VLFGASLIAATLALGLAERDAAACGGCFHPPTQTVSDITDERMLLSVSPTQTTLFDQIRYSGNPAAFAWVLPIRPGGTVTVGLSADVLFDSMDELTATIIHPPAGCPAAPSHCTSGGCGASANSNGTEYSPDPGSVTITKQQNVGPYETVQLHATDSSALSAWLTQNSFVIPSEVTPVLDAYVSEGFDFLAMKLLPDEGVQAMRPVRVSMPGMSLSLPLRMASVGTGATVGITIWVVSDGRYEPQNFPFFHIEDQDLVWDFQANLSNYTALRAQDEASFGGKGWEIESSIDLNEQVITGVIDSGGVYYGTGSTAPSAPASGDYVAVDPGDSGAPGETAEQVRGDDLTALFAGLPGPNIRVTRIRSDVAHAAMTTDLILQASADQSELSNVRTVIKSTGLQCPLYDNCSVVGYGTPEQAQASQDGKGGCGASPQANGGPMGSLLALAGFLGMVIARARRRGV
jgi:hypothetical protein